MSHVNVYWTYITNFNKRKSIKTVGHTSLMSVFIDRKSCASMKKLIFEAVLTDPGVTKMKLGIDCFVAQEQSC